MSFFNPIIEAIGDINKKYNVANKSRGLSLDYMTLWILNVCCWSHNLIHLTNLTEMVESTLHVSNYKYHCKNITEIN